ncbi:MAG TPA: uroporphyrinogen-III synthase [Terracidiphilus sp.]|nr:uroporphyrinogen-III synthase [Terracidiphilus sp.]
MDGLSGLKVLSLESRRETETAKLIRSYGGEPVLAPAVREIALESNVEALEFADRLLNGEFDLVIFTTGVGVRRLMEIMETRHERARVLDAMRRVKLAARGAKTAAALREMGLTIAASASEPATWRELVAALDAAFGPSLEGLRAAVQEYGTSNGNLLSALSSHGVEWTRVPVYHWALPEDVAPLRAAVRALAAEEIDVVIFLNAVQVDHLFQVAESMEAVRALEAGLRRTLVLSIGPSTSEALTRHCVSSDFEPSHPKMGFLVNEAAQCAAALLAGKRGPVAPATEDGDSRQLSAIQQMHDIGHRMAVSDPLHAVLNQLVGFIETLLSCDSCFIYVLEDSQLVMRASKNPHPDQIDHLGLKMGQGITGWVAERREPVAIESGALRDPRFESFKDLPEDTFEAFLSVPILARGRLVGVINVQHRQAHRYTLWEVQAISMTGFLVGAEIEMARLEGERDALTGQLESRKLIERAKGLLQRDHGIPEDEAYRMMQRESRQRRKSMREIAEAVILSDELRRAAAGKSVSS